MNKMNKLILTAMLLAVGLVGKANATVAQSTSSVVAIVVQSTPTVSGQLIRLKACSFGNASALASCVNLIDRAASDTTKLTLCAAAGTSTPFPPSGQQNAVISGTPGALPQWLGEDLTFAGAFVVTSSTPTALNILTCSYIIK